MKARFLHLATVFALRPCWAANSLSGAFDRCIAARTACVLVAQPWSICPNNPSRNVGSDSLIPRHAATAHLGSALPPTMEPLPTRPNRPLQPTGRLKSALDRMVFGAADGIPLDYVEAGRTVGLSSRSMRRALERPHVRAYLNQARQVARASINAKNIWRLGQLRDQQTNPVAACKIGR